MMALLSRLGTSVRRRLATRLRMPWVSTRLMMVFVALAAFLIGVLVRLPRSVSYYARSAREADLESIDLIDREHFLSEARACQHELDQVHCIAGIDKATDQYLRGRVERPTAEANQLARNAAYHRGLKDKYRRAALLFWETVSSDSPPPLDTLVKPVKDPRLMQAHEVRGERGKSIAFAPDGRTLAIGCTNNV